jgi:hypothetical protein
MAKSMSVPVEALLHEYRMKALTTPLASYEMTNVDKEMSDVLSRTDIPADQRLKMYFALLDKYKHVYNVYTATQKPPGKSKDAIEKEREDLKDVVKGVVSNVLAQTKEHDSYESAIEDEDGAILLAQIQGSSSPISRVETPAPPPEPVQSKKDDDDKYDAEVVRQLRSPTNYGRDINLDEQQMYEDILENFNTSTNKKKLSRSSVSKGGDLATYGFKHEIPKMFRYLLSRTETDQPTFNNRLLKVVAETIYNALPTTLVRSSDAVESVFPNMKYFFPEDTVKRPASKIPVSSPQAVSNPPPVKKTYNFDIPSFKKTKHAGTGIRVMINKWNDLIR